MKNVDYHAPLTRKLVADGVFKEREFTVIDVGMRGGGNSVWNSLGKAGFVLGFEPDREEADRINAQHRMFHQRCEAIALGATTGRQTIHMLDCHQAASGFHKPNGAWLAHRFYVEIAHEADGKYREVIDGFRIDPNLATYRPVNVETVALDDHCAGLDIDFLKIDTEGSEMDVLNGAQRSLKTVSMVEVEVNFAKHRDVPLFHEISAFMAARGFELYDLDMHRMSRGVLPFPVAGDWRDHRGNLTGGPTTGGQPVTGDALFVRTPILHPYQPRKALRLACLFEMFGFYDCAAETFRYYGADLGVDVESCLSMLAKGNYRSYIVRYIAKTGRVQPLTSAPAS